MPWYLWKLPSFKRLKNNSSIINLKYFQGPCASISPTSVIPLYLVKNSPPTMLPYKKSLDQNYAQNAMWITPIMIWVIVYCYFPIYDKKVFHQCSNFAKGGLGFSQGLLPSIISMNTERKKQVHLYPWEKYVRLDTIKWLN